LSVEKLTEGGCQSRSVQRAVVSREACRGRLSIDKRAEAVVS